MNASSPLPSSTICPICLHAAEDKFAIGDFRIFECTDCHHCCTDQAFGQTHVGDYYSDQYFTGGAAGYDDYLANRPIVEAHSRQYARLLTQFRPSAGSCFAVGAAAGFDLVGFHEAGWRVGGLDPNATMCRHAKELFDFDLQCCSLESVDLSSIREGFDLAIALQVMAHFVNPRFAAEQLSKLVRSRGLLLIETWNYQSRTARIFGKHWHEYSPPTVIQWFSPRSLEKLMHQFGFRRIDLGRPKKFIYGHHAASLLKYKLASNPLVKYATSGLNLIPSKLRIPYPSEDLFWMLFERT